MAMMMQRTSTREPDSSDEELELRRRPPPSPTKPKHALTRVEKLASIQRKRMRLSYDNSKAEADDWTSVDLAKQSFSLPRVMPGNEFVILDVPRNPTLLKFFLKQAPSTLVHMLLSNRRSEYLAILRLLGLD